MAERERQPPSGGVRHWAACTPGSSLAPPAVLGSGPVPRFRHGHPMNVLSTAFAGLCLLLVGRAVIGSAQDTDRTPAHSFDAGKLAWLVGTWEVKDGDKTTEETWLPLKGSTMIGVSHTYSPGRTHFFEFLRIMAKKDSISYIPQPGGDPPVPFLMTELDDDVAVFENPEHDHPQRICYERTEKGMTATVSLLDGTRSKSFVFTRKSEAAR